MVNRKKILITKPGGYDQLKVVNDQLPDLGIGEAQIKVEAIGVNYADVVIRWGLYESANKLMGYPITPGFEYSGTITAIKPLHDKPARFKVGDKVCGVTFFGGYSSHVNVKLSHLFPLPAKFSFAEGAAFPAVFLTAYHGLFQQFILYPHSKVLVHSAAGGVGQALVQLAKAKGHEVVGVIGSSHKRGHLEELRVDHVIDKSKENLWQQARLYAPGGYDAVFDANGASTLKQSFEHLAPMGKLVSYGFHSFFPHRGGKLNYLKLVSEFIKLPRFNPVKMSAANKSLITFNLSFLFPREDLLQGSMQDMMTLVESGKIKAPHVTPYALEEVGRAHAHLESGKSIGKLVLIP